MLHGPEASSIPLSVSISVSVRPTQTETSMFQYSSQLKNIGLYEPVTTVHLLLYWLIDDAHRIWHLCMLLATTVSLFLFFVLARQSRVDVVGVRWRGGSCCKRRAEEAAGIKRDMRKNQTSVMNQEGSKEREDGKLSETFWGNLSVLFCSCISVS